MRVDASVSQIKHVGADVFTIEDDDVLPFCVQAVAQGTAFVRVIIEAYVMLIEVILVRNGVELNCRRLFAKFKVFLWAKVDDLIKVFPIWSLDFFALDFIHFIIGQIFKYFRKFYNAICADDHFLPWHILDHFLDVLSCDDKQRWRLEFLVAILMVLRLAHQPPDFPW